MKRIFTKLQKLVSKHNKKYDDVLKDFRKRIKEKFIDFPLAFATSDGQIIISEDEMTDFCKYWHNRKPELYQEFLNRYRTFQEQSVNIMKAVDGIVGSVGGKLSLETRVGVEIFSISHMKDIENTIKIAETLIAIFEGAKEKDS